MFSINVLVLWWINLETVNMSATLLFLSLIFQNVNLFYSKYILFKLKLNLKIVRFSTNKNQFQRFLDPQKILRIQNFWIKKEVKHNLRPNTMTERNHLGICFAGKKCGANFFDVAIPMEWILRLLIIIFHNPN